MTLIDQGRKLIAALRAELTLPEAERSTQAGDSSLARAIGEIERMVRVLETTGRPAPGYPRVLARQVTDGWNWRSPLSTEVLEFGKAYDRLRERTC